MIPSLVKSRNGAMRLATAGEATVKENWESSSKVTLKAWCSPPKWQERTRARVAASRGKGNWTMQPRVRQPCMAPPSGAVIGERSDDHVVSSNSKPRSWQTPMNAHRVLQPWAGSRGDVCSTKMTVEKDMDREW